MNASAPPRTGPASQSEHLEQDPRPIVALPRSGLPGAAIAVIAALAALLLFVALDSQRSRAAVEQNTYRSGQGMLAPPPELAVPPEPVAAPPRVEIVTTPAPVVQPARPAPAPYTPAPLPEPVQPSPPPIIVAQLPQRPSRRADTPALVLDGGTEQTGNNAPAAVTEQGGRGRPPAAVGGSGDDAPARATLLGNRSTLVLAGTIIPAVLETPIDTARPGLLRAVVSQDTRGFDGRRVLVTRGSRLVGEYQSDVRSGQNRVLVTWTRLIRPDGVTIRIGSPAADPLGGAGIPGRVNTFFFQRFASAVLQSALTIGVNLASRPTNGSVIVGLPNAAGNVGQSLISPNDLRPKITIKQGAALNVFVARDLDFSGVPTAR